jgi:hypothetical protein
MDEPGIASKLETKGKRPMRAIMIAMLASATLGLAGTSTTMAAPASGAVILGDALTSESLVQEAQFRRRRVVRECFHRGFSRRRCVIIRRR